jgi:hypothetical protein
MWAVAVVGREMSDARTRSGQWCRAQAQGRSWTSQPNSIGRKTNSNVPAPTCPIKKKSDGPLRTAYICLAFEEPTNPKILFFLTFFLVRFWAFLGKGSSKTRLKKNAKSPCQKLFPRKFSENRQKFRCRFSSTFLFYRVFRCFLAMGVQKYYKRRFTKQSCRKTFYKKIDKRNPNRFFLDFVLSLITFLGVSRCSVRGVQKHDKKISGKNLTDPGTFLASEEPTNHVGARHFFFSAPCLCPFFWEMFLKISGLISGFRKKISGVLELLIFMQRNGQKRGKKINRKKKFSKGGDAGGARIRT